MNPLNSFPSPPAKILSLALIIFIVGFLIYAFPVSQKPIDENSVEYYQTHKNDKMPAIQDESEGLTKQDSDMRRKRGFAFPGDSITSQIGSYTIKIKDWATLDTINNMSQMRQNGITHFSKYVQMMHDSMWIVLWPEGGWSAFDDPQGITLDTKIKRNRYHTDTAFRRKIRLLGHFDDQ